MRRLTYLMVILLALVLGSSASATTGWNKCTSTEGKGALHPGQVACNDPIIGDLNSSILDVSACNGTFTVLYNSDTTGTAADTTVEILICVLPICSLNNCVVLDDTPALTGAAGVSEIYGSTAKWICVDGTTDPLSGDKPRVLIHCN